MRTQTTDTQIIQLLTERDESALTIIEREYGRLCRKISLDILSNQQDTEECCNDALMRVWNSIPPIHPDSLRAYLVTIVRHLSIAEKEQDSGFFFLNQRGQRITTRGISGELKKIAEKYGIDTKVVYPHSFRHRFAKSFLDRCNDIAFLADLMGHERLKLLAFISARPQRNSVRS